MGWNAGWKTAYRKACATVRRFFGIATEMAMLLALATGSLFAQTSTGSIGGTVTDASDAAIAGATVTATNQRNGRGSQHHDRRSLANIASRPWSPASTPSTSGRRALRRCFWIRSRYRDRSLPAVNAKLKVGGTDQTVVVEASNAEVQTERGELSHTISSAEVQNLPIDSLDPYALATTLPGCGIVTDGTNGFTNGTWDSQYSSNGSRPRGNNFLIEGQDNNDAGIHGQGLQPENFEAIQEVAVLLNSTSAEYGHGGGAIANLIYKSGTNSFHGAAWDRLSNSSLDANDHANALAEIPKSKYRRELLRLRFRRPAEEGQAVLLRLLPVGQLPLVGEWRRFDSSLGRRLIACSSSMLPTRGLPRCWRHMASSCLQGDPTRTGAPAPIPLGAGPGDRMDRGSVQVGLFNRTGVPLEYDQPEFDSKGDYIITRERHAEPALHSHQLQHALRFLQLSQQSSGLRFRAERSLAECRHRLHPHLQSDSTQRISRLLRPHGPLVFAAAGQRSCSHARRPSPSTACRGGARISRIPQGRFHDTYQVQDTVSWTKGKTFCQGRRRCCRRAGARCHPRQFTGSISYAAGGGYQALGNYLDDFSGGTSTVSQTFGSPIVHASLPSQNYFVQDSWKARPNLIFGLRPAL